MKNREQILALAAEVGKVDGFASPKVHEFIFDLYLAARADGIDACVESINWAHPENTSRRLMLALKEEQS